MMLVHRNARSLWRLVQNIYKSPALFTRNIHQATMHIFLPYNVNIVRTVVTSNHFHRKDKNLQEKDEAENWTLDHDVKLFDSDDLFIGIMPVKDAEKYARTHSSVMMLLGEESSGIKSYKLEKHDETIHNPDKVIRHKSSKMFRVKTKTDPHDLEVKIKKIRATLEKGTQVNISIYSGPVSQTENYHKQNEVMKTITEAVKDIAVVSRAQRTETLCTFKLDPVQANDL